MKVFKHFFKTLQAMIYYLTTALVRKDEKLWLFGAWKGMSYSDNAKYLYEYVSVEHPEITAVWVTKNNSVYEYLKEKNMKVVLYPSKEAKRLIAKAKYMFQTEGSRDIGNLPVGGTTIIQLFHGIPAKSLKWFEGYSKFKKTIIKIESDNHARSLWASPSEFYTKTFSKIMDVPEKKFFLSGCPRCDAVNLTSNGYIDKIKEQTGCKKVVLYLPTHRNWGKDFDKNFILNGLDIIETCLEGTPICFLYKPHHNEIKLLNNIEKNYKHVFLLDGTGIVEQDVYSYLYDCDCLISDYSSVIYDYLCVERPIVLFNYDLEDYINNDGGLLDDYFNYPVGPFCKSWTDLITKFIGLMENDTWLDKRKEAYKYFNTYSDGFSCKRVTEFVLSLNK